MKNMEIGRRKNDRGVRYIMMYFNISIRWLFWEKYFSQFFGRLEKKIRATAWLNCTESIRPWRDIVARKWWGIRRLESLLRKPKLQFSLLTVLESHPPSRPVYAAVKTQGEEREGEKIKETRPTRGIKGMTWGGCDDRRKIATERNARSRIFAPIFPTICFHCEDISRSEEEEKLKHAHSTLIWVYERFVEGGCKQVSTCQSISRDTLREMYL